MPEFIGLRRRAFRVALTDNDEGRGLYVFDKPNGRAFLIRGGIVVNGCAEERDHPLIDQILSVVALPISDAGASNSGTETISLRDSPHGHESAVAPSSNAKTRRFDRIFFRGRVDAGHCVAQIATAKIFHVCARKIFALAVTSAGIGKENVITAHR